jgi:signal transduction histidine kinase
MEDESQLPVSQAIAVGPRGPVWVLLAGLWAVPVAVWLMERRQSGLTMVDWLALVVAVAVPVVGVQLWRRERKQSAKALAAADEAVAQARLQVDAVRFRTARLRDELQAADRQARLSHQLTLLGQFTAGFMHEFNNPLAIVAGRLEVLLEERKEDEELRADLMQMLKETRYMSRIAGTLLQALRRERAGEVYEPCVIGDALAELEKGLAGQAAARGIEFVMEMAESPRVDVPAHVVEEVVRGLVNNALQALDGRKDGRVRLRLEPYQTAGAKVVVRVEDNGPGVPEDLRQHLFEPFVSQSSGREHLGLGLFLAASLLDMYDARIRYEVAAGGGACFVLELPPTRFTRGQPYHWFIGSEAE